MRDGGAVKSIFPWADQPKEKYILRRQFSVKRRHICRSGAECLMLAAGCRLKRLAVRLGAGTALTKCAHEGRTPHKTYNCRPTPAANHDKQYPKGRP